MEKGKLKEKLYVLPLALIVGITPLIVHYKKIELDEVTALFWIRKFNTDFFSYYKMWWFLCCVVLTLIAFYIYLRKEKKFKKTIYYIPLALYGLMIIISTIFSKCQYTSYYGFPDRYEGMPVLLGYIFVLIAAINLVNKKHQFKFLFTCLLIAAVIIGSLGLAQFFGYDFFQSEIGKNLMLAGVREDVSGKLDYRFEDGNIIYSTFYNPNYVGSYFVILLMITLSFYLFSNKQHLLIIYGLISCLMYANLLGSTSRAGFLGAICSLLIVSLLIHKVIFQKWRQVLLILLAFIIIFNAMDAYAGGKLTRELLSLGRETRVAFEGEQEELQGIRTVDNDLFIETDSTLIRISRSENKELQFHDGSGELINYEYYPENSSEQKKVIFQNSNYQIFDFKLNKEHNVLEFKYGDRQTQFLINDKGFWIQGLLGRAYKIQEVESWGFTGREGLASKRGYIWSRTLPLLKNAIITGYGPDTFALYFPQHDYVGKFKFFNTTNKIVDKPHNMYLQIAVNTGIISLIAIIALFALYFFRSISLYRNISYRVKESDRFMLMVGIGVLAAFIGYAAAGVFNDSVVSVAPVFWIGLGVGISANLEVRKSNKQKLINSSKM